jgi:hypothetical protein
MVSQLSKTSLGMPLGAILEEAALVSHAQIEVALRDQMYYSDLKLGEILALRGWIKQETADFFVVYLPTLRKKVEKKPIGHYLQEAALLSEDQIKSILDEQKHTLVRFGALAVLKGYLKQGTVDFFVRYLYPEHQRSSLFMEKRTTPLASQKKIVQKTFTQHQLTAIQKHTYTEDDLEYLLDEESPDDIQVRWLG